MIDGQNLNETYFINQNYNIDNDQEYYLIQCTIDNGCLVYKSGEETAGNEYYVNGGKKTTLEDTIIQCIISDDEIVVCTTDQETTKAADKQIYVNAANKQQIIRCTTANGCVATDTSPSNLVPEYYLNGDDVNQSSLIKCPMSENCTIISEELKEGSFSFLNANFIPTADTRRPLIKCIDGVCILDESNAEIDKPEFYVNADATNKEVLKDDLIKCTKQEDDADSVATCALASGKTNDIYLNAHFNATTNNMPIIWCTSETGCTQSTVNTTNDNFGYYVNAGHATTELLSDTLIECNEECSILPATDADVYINELNHSQLIICSTDKGCTPRNSNATPQRMEIFLNCGNISKENESVEHFQDLIICTNYGETTECKVQNGEMNGVYFNPATPGETIQCLEGKPCMKVPLTANEDGSPTYYVNSDPIGKENGPLVDDLIKCKMVRETITCDIISGNDGDVYFNGIGSEDNSGLTSLIICDSVNGCITPINSITDSSPPRYYVNAGSFLPTKNDTLIQCAYESEKVNCKLKASSPNEVYINYGSDLERSPLIVCTKNGCKTSASMAVVGDNEYYMNSGDSETGNLIYDIIECSKENEESAVSCNEIKDCERGIYLNSNYAESGDKNQLIQCTGSDGCKGLRTENKNYATEYYLNAESKTLSNAVIICTNRRCKKMSVEKGPTYYVGKSEEDLDGLIKCDATSCSFKSAFTSPGYYLNAGINKMTNQTIICDAETGCETLSVDLGYYVNAGDPSNPIIKCEKEKSPCIAENVECPKRDEEAIAGDYCVRNNQIIFYAQNNSTAIAATKLDDYFTYSLIGGKRFPGITRSTSTLFKISYYYINRFYQNGVVVLDKNGKLLSSLDADEANTLLYDCNADTKVCTQRPGCTPYTYMYDSENKKALFCNENERLKHADITGYVVDSNRAQGTNHPYLIRCENGGKKCVTGRPRITTYYENNGYNSETNSLIQCSSNNCETTVAEVGYYLGHDGAGIIQCTTPNSCAFIQVKRNIKYVNAGIDKMNYPIIECSKHKGCTVVKGKVGYYMTHSSSVLIHCVSPRLCEEITPIVNYYDNADADGSGDGLINCVENGSSVSCEVEASNNGFYVSSTPGMLIRCREGSKCRSVTVKNGIFRGALRALLGGGSKRYDEPSPIESPVADESYADFDEHDVEDKKIEYWSPRDSEEAYGIIHCVSGTCTVLSAEEVSAIPVCEFNKNKCYITLEYSMMKGATTSISAGNICTNEDRSVFYFATDTVVVKPNVIDGKIATYVETTTYTNCLVVDDSYTDKYFTVGSKIYLLDQGSVVQFYEPGNYFINTHKNTIVTGKDINLYNDEHVKLYSCNGNNCRIINNPTTETYIVDINKRIMSYSIRQRKYQFAYPKDIICIFSNNRCTPNADMNDREFCITYKGELALVRQSIKNRETGDCYKATSLTDPIYGYGQFLYTMDLYSAQMVDTTGFYLVNAITNTTVQFTQPSRNKHDTLILYGCHRSNCKIYEPEPDTYYYDDQAKILLRHQNNLWSVPETSGLALIAVDPSTPKYIHQLTKAKDGKTFTVDGPVHYGYYYTINEEMYYCQEEDNNTYCEPIKDSGYYFTEAGEVYHCIYDSEEREPTECTRQSCFKGQYYYINDKYYRCESGYRLAPVKSRHCSRNEPVVVNFPVALTEDYPVEVQHAINAISKNNNSTAIVRRRGRNSLDSVPGVFTNCSYDVEEGISTFDLVCINNYVKVNEETKDVQICSIEKLGYVECIRDDDNPEKCQISAGWISAIPRSLLNLLIIAIIVNIFTYYF